MHTAVTLAVVLALASASASAQPGPPPPPFPTPTSIPGEPLFVISGRGYGHGVGMSQYGAYGLARQGATYDEILAHYYTGTALERASAREVRVLLAEGRRAITVGSDGPFSIVEGSGRTLRVPAGTLTLRADLALPGASGTVDAVPPIVVRPGRNGPLTLDGKAYRGRFQLVPQGGFLRAVNFVPLEAYLHGVVAGEVPHTWPAEALKAQAVAARSYALATLVKGKPFDLYADVRSQVYLGVAGEQASTTNAVNATRGQVVTYGGKVATTYYSSTSGGRTASAEDVFGFAVPYLVSRPDPADRASPYHRWGPVLVGGRTLQAKLGLQARVLDVTGTVTPSRRLRALIVQTPSGTTTVPAGALRTGLGLRSTWVTIGVLRLDPPRAALVFGSSMRLSGLARGLPSPTIASSVSGALWAPVAAAERSARGAVSIVVKPERTMRYRLEAGGASSPAVLVRVAPRLQLAPTDEPGVLLGTIRPRLARTAVTIERREGARWVGVAEATVDASGAYRADVGATRGSFRARVPAAAGLVEAITPVVILDP